MNTIPPEPGFYALELRLTYPAQLCVGQLGEQLFPAGVYIYAGSSLGPGGLRARLGRHLQAKEKRIHWHIDYLGQAARVEALAYIIATPDKFLRSKSAKPRQDAIPIECLWSQVLARMTGAGIPVSGFGASDCRSGCRAHLVAFLPPDFVPDERMPLLAQPQIRDQLAGSAGVPLKGLIVHPISP